MNKWFFFYFIAFIYLGITRVSSKNSTSFSSYFSYKESNKNNKVANWVMIAAIFIHLFIIMNIVFILLIIIDQFIGFVWKKLSTRCEDKTKYSAISFFPFPG